jgi:hypothetical protein
LPQQIDAVETVLCRVFFIATMPNRSLPLTRIELAQMGLVESCTRSVARVARTESIESLNRSLPAVRIEALRVAKQAGQASAKTARKVPDKIDKLFIGRHSLPYWLVYQNWRAPRGCHWRQL